MVRSNALSSRLVICGVAAAGIGVGCGPSETAPSQQAPLDAVAEHTAQAPVVAAPATMETYLPQAVQIDVVGTGPGDANLLAGADSDGTASANLPASTLPFIDWNDLGPDMENHRLLDLSDASGRDPSAFPGSNECVGPANVLSKMDLTYVAVANNQQFAYFAVQRSANNGDAGYYWVFTKKPPWRVRGEAPCAADKDRLVYDISGKADGVQGDVLIKGHFKPSGEPIIEVFHAVRDQDHVPATAAIDYTSGLWAKVPDAGLAAVNTTKTAPGSFGAAGVKSMSGTDLDVEIFAEAAVPLTAFTGGNGCGATFYGSVITRSSGAGGTSPDLKDLAGPALFNFGSVTIEATAKPTCELALDYALTSVKGIDGQPVPNPVCAWSVDGQALSTTTCTGTATVAAAGAHTASVTVTDPASNCSASTTLAPVTVSEKLGVTADLTATCTSSFDYSATPTGGSPAGVEVAWTFTGPGTVTPATSSTATGSASVAQAGVEYTGSVKVTDKRDDGLTCTATASDKATPFAPLAISLAPTAAPETCPDMKTDAVTWAATTVGGNGAWSIAWNGATCTGSSCTIDPANTDFCEGPISLSATLSDTSGLCPPATSETETYQKVTTVTASNN